MTCVASLAVVTLHTDPLNAVIATVGIVGVICVLAALGMLIAARFGSGGCTCPDAEHEHGCPQAGNNDDDGAGA